MMILSFIIMAFRFITGIQPKKKRGLWLIIALVGALLLSSGPTVSIISGIVGHKPGIIQELRTPAQSFLVWIGRSLIIILIILTFFGLPII